MSELQSQVKTLRKGLLLSTGLSQIASLYLSPVEAAKIDVSTIYTAAAQSLQILAQYDGRFSIFESENHILHSSSVFLQRELKTKDENNEIDRQIESLLKLLGLYASEQDAHRVVEYLLRRFRIHEINSIALIKAFVHIHDMKVFARIVQLCTIHDTVFSFLEGVKQSGTPIARVNLVKRCTKDTSLLKLITDHVRSVVKLAYSTPVKPESLVAKGSDRILSFFVALVVELFQEKVEEAHIRIIYTFITEGISYTGTSIRSFPFRKSSFMVLAQLNRTQSLGDTVVTSLLQVLISAFTTATADQVEDVVFSVCILLSYQKLQLPLNTLFSLLGDISSGDTAFLSTVERLSSKFDPKEVLGALSRSLTLTFSISLTTDQRDAVARHLVRILSSASMSEEVVDHCLSNLLSSNVAHAVSAPVLKLIAQRYPLVFDRAVAEASSRSEPSELKHLLQSVFMEAAYHQPTSAGTSLLLSLQHASPHIRLEALNAFAETVPAEAQSTEDLIALSEAVGRGLLESSFELATRAWRRDILSRVSQHVPPSTLLTAFSGAWQWWITRLLKQSREAFPVLLGILECISEPHVLQALASPAGHKWLVVTLSVTIQGALALQYSGDLTTERSQTFTKLSVAAVDAAKGCKDSIKFFEALTSSLIKKTALTDLLPLCLHKLATTDMTALKMTVSLLGASIIDEASTFVIAGLFGNTLAKIEEAGGLKDASQTIISAQVLLLLELIPLYDIKDASALIPLIILTIKSLEMSHVDVASNFETYVSSFVSPSPEPTSAHMPLLIALLESANPALSSVVGTLLELHFQSRAEVVLLQIAYAEVMSVEARVAALCSLCSFIASINEKNSVASFITLHLHHNVSHSLLMCIPLVIHTCSSADTMIRLAGKELAKSFASLSKKLYIEVNCSTSEFLSNRIAIKDVCALISALLRSDMDSPFTQNTSLTPVQLISMRKLLVETLKLFKWNLHATTVSVMKMLSKQSSLPETWGLFEVLISSYDARIPSHLSAALFDEVFLCLERADDIDQDTLKRVTSSLVNFLRDSSLKTTAIRCRLLSVYAGRWAMYMSSEQRAAVFAALISVQKLSSGQNDVLSALNKTEVARSVVVDILTSSLLEFLNVWKVSVEMVIEEAVTDVEDEMELGGLSAPLQQLCAVIEGTSEQLLKPAGPDWTSEPSLGAVAGLLFDTVAALNDRRFKSILTTEYAKALVLDLVSVCLQGYELEAPLVTSKSAKKKIKQIQQLDPSSSGYPRTRVARDAELIFIALQTSSTSSLQLSALTTLEKLLRLAPEVVNASLYSLGRLLTRTANEVAFSKDGRTEREGLVEDILGKLCNIMQSDSTGFIPQHLIQPLCFHYSAMSSFRRGYLVRVAVDLLGDKALPAAVSVLLTHALVAYEPESLDSEITPDADHYILLSRSSQRKSQRQLRTSKPEDIFKLALDFPLRKSGSSQVSSLVTLLRASLQLLTSAMQPDAVSAVVTCGDMLVDVSALQSYANDVFAELKPAREPNAEGACISSLLLHLEYVYEMLENPGFHRMLVGSGDRRSAVTVQSMFLEVAEQALEIIAFVSECLESELYVHRTFTLQLGSASLVIEFPMLGKCVYEWGLNIIKSLQRLLDGPTFIAILQELLDHEQMPIRQKAAQMLADRLAELKIKSTGKNNESALYLDLCSRLREVVKKYSNEVIDVAATRPRGLVHSAIICIDVLAKSLDKNTPGWIDVLSGTVDEIVALCSTLSAALVKGGSKEINLELLTLQGSAYLCCGTICGAIGPRALSILSVLMTLMLDTMTKEGEHMLKLATRGKASDGYILRTVVLILRSLIAAVTSIVAEMPSFFHPYLHTTVIALLYVYNVKGIDDDGQLSRDIDRCLSVMASAVPLRLALPALLAHVSHMLSLGHKQARRFIEYLGSLWASLDRPTLSTCLPDVTALVILTLDYRREYGSCDNVAADEVDEIAVGSAVDFCLKLTEQELKGFLVKLIEWRDLYDEDPMHSKRYARGVVFFQLVAALCHKLRSIFIPLMSYVWPAATAAIAAKMPKVSSKKRKAGEDDDVGIEDRAISEMLRRTRWVLEGIKAACAYDDDDFIDEERFSSIDPKVGDLLSLAGSFGNGEDYSAYMEAYVTPCLTALATAVTKDVLWKPLNHKLLMLTRDKRRHVKVAAIRTLQQLFIEVGEEYLILMPECLPFVSELLESDNQDVLNATVDLVKDIESLSGEKLDQYLN